MAERWVVNASPLIVLSKINHQHLLTQLPEEVVVPQAVVAEINVRTLGIIIRARQTNMIPAAVPVLKALQSHGFRIDDRVVARALQQTVGETWEPGTIDFRR